MRLEERTRQRLASLTEKGKGLLEGATRNDFSDLSIDTQGYAEWSTQALACLTQVFGSGHVYPSNLESVLARGLYLDINVQQGLGILGAASEDVEQGHLTSLQDMAVADVFSDFLDQADHLLVHGYSAPAASLAGAVLENGLRSLAERNEIPVKPRDDLSALNSKLAGKTVYNRLRQKQVAVWIDVRNAADHGRFDEFTDDDVADVVKGVRNLLAEML